MHAASGMSAKLADFNIQQATGCAMHILKRLFFVLLGSLVGYGLWTLFFDHYFLSAVAAALIVNQRNDAILFRILGDENLVIAVMLFVASLLRTFPASVILGAAMGFLLPHTRYKRSLCYAVLIWPLALYSWQLVRPHVDDASKGVYILQAVAIYALFYLSVFVSFKLFKKEKQK
jgi:hypothetical protein